VPAVIDSVLINGYGRYAGGPASPLAVVNVEAGKKISFPPTFDGMRSILQFHYRWTQVYVIEVEGNNVEPLLVDS
jgi:iron transport multicopper oxidase